MSDSDDASVCEHFSDWEIEYTVTESAVDVSGRGTRLVEVHFRRLIPSENGDPILKKYILVIVINLRPRANGCV